ncbi:MAG: hypothetical protein M1829_006696 [Trizodia sp. TS-e1964]|nr:MAG: hypothetical protein M1829_006696 [Trizodia sp. TS-e1964]
MCWMTPPSDITPHGECVGRCAYVLLTGDKSNCPYQRIVPQEATLSLDSGSLPPSSPQRTGSIHTVNTPYLIDSCSPIRYSKNSCDESSGTLTEGQWPGFPSVPKAEEPIELPAEKSHRAIKARFKVVKYSQVNSDRSPIKFLRVKVRKERYDDAEGKSSSILATAQNLVSSFKQKFSKSISLTLK